MHLISIKSNFLILIFTSINLYGAPIILPSAPGIESIEIDQQAAIAIADTSYNSHDVHFLQMMIMHHDQAMVMSKLAPLRTNSKNILDLAGRIDSSQEDEMLFMKSWLQDRNESTDYKHNHKMMKMAGMASTEEISQLKGSDGVEFDRLFLRLMINHHDGAIEMVDDLRDQSGSAYDPILNEFVADLTNDQAIEIERMNGFLIGLSDDPRANLSAGLYHADEAIYNLEKLVSLKKPVGFFDPSNPMELRPQDTTSNNVDDSEEPKSIEQRSRNSRYPMLSFTNTDMAFRDNILIAGSYHGFNIYELNDDGIPLLNSSVICPGGQGDVSIVGDLLIMSVEQNRGRIDCGLEGVNSEPSEDRFRGIRIFDISDLLRPQQVGLVQTCRGSHTHSVVGMSSDNQKIIVYNSGTSNVRDQEELESCFEDIPGDNRTALFRIDIIEIPIQNPEESKIVSSPTVFADNQNGVLAGLWRGGDHGDDTQRTSRTDQCHDITVFPSANIAAGACSGNGILFDISDPYNPQRIDVVTDTGFAYWHSATFNNDGTKVVFTDEWGGGGRPRCRAWDPLNWGANAIYDIVDKKLIFKSHYKMPAPQKESENCVAHNGSIIPIPGKDIFVQAWYQGGISLIDFTDSDNPIEIGFFDRGPIDEENLITGGYWSVYYYRGKIYATEIVRGLDVFQLTESEFLSQAQIDMAMKAMPAFGPKNVFNPQQQVPMRWVD
jgi:uncharacterized protein (DUF305 family)